MIVGKAVVSTILRTGDARPFLEVGMNRGWLTGDGIGVFKDEDQRTYEWLLDNWQEYGSVNRDRFERAFPRYSVDKGRHQPAELIADVRALVERNVAAGLLADIQDRDVDPAALADLIHAASDRMRLGLSRGRDQSVELGDIDIDRFIDDTIPPGVPLGIKLLDEEYGGTQPGQLVTLVGRQKSTKSTLLAWAAIHAWLKDYDVLFYNVELDLHFMRQKLYSIGAHVSPERLRRGGGDDGTRNSERRRLKKFHEDLQAGGFRLSQKYQHFSVDDIASDVDRLKKKATNGLAVYIDGFYFMEDKRSGRGEDSSAASSHKAIEHISADLKALAMDKRVPIHVTTQAQEKQQGKKSDPGIEARTIQGGTGLLKSSDLVLGVDMRDRKVFINQIFDRYGEVPDVQVDWDWDDMTMDVELAKFMIDEEGIDV